MARIEAYDGHRWKNGDYPDMSAENLQAVDDAVVNAVKACNEHDNNIEELLSPTYTGSDTTDSGAAGWTTFQPLTSGESHKSLLAKVSQMFKNVRYLWKLLGSTDISKIGGGTVTGAISQLNTSVTALNSEQFPMSLNGYANDIDDLENGIAIISWGNKSYSKLPKPVDQTGLMITLLRPDRQYGLRLYHRIDADPNNFYYQEKSQNIWSGWRQIPSNAI